MTYCAGKFGVGSGSNMKWFTDYAEAQAYENQELHKKIKAKLQRNGLVILTRDQWNDYEQAEAAASQTALGQVAD